MSAEGRRDNGPYLSILDLTNVYRHFVYPKLVKREHIDFVLRSCIEHPNFGKEDLAIPPRWEEIAPNVPKVMYDKLTELNYRMCTSKVVHSVQSGNKDMRKILIRLQDGFLIETCVMRFGSNNNPRDEAGVMRCSSRERRTVCVSSQVGCNMGCAFCATGTVKTKASLTGGEILEQIVLASVAEQEEDPLDTDATRGSNDLIKRSFRNVVFMGMGEPLDNYIEVSRAIRLLTSARVMNVTPHRICISTVGHNTARIAQLKKDNPKVSLALSLHAPTQELRDQLIPTSKLGKLEDLLAVCYDFVDHQRSLSRANEKRQQLLIEYVLLANINDSDEHASQLAKLVLPYADRTMINLIPYNKTDVPRDLEAPSPQRVNAFHDAVRAYGITCFVRQIFGRDIGGACGQLKYVSSMEQPEPDQNDDKTPSVDGRLYTDVADLVVGSRFDRPHPVEKANDPQGEAGRGDISFEDQEIVEAESELESPVFNYLGRPHLPSDASPEGSLPSLADSPNPQELGASATHSPPPWPISQPSSNPMPLNEKTFSRITCEAEALTSVISPSYASVKNMKEEAASYSAADDHSASIAGRPEQPIPVEGVNPPPRQPDERDHQSPVTNTVDGGTGSDRAATAVNNVQSIPSAPLSVSEVSKSAARASAATSPFTEAIRARSEQPLGLKTATPPRDRQPVGDRPALTPVPAVTAAVTPHPEGRATISPPAGTVAVAVGEGILRRERRGANEDNAERVADGVESLRGSSVAGADERCNHRGSPVVPAGPADIEHTLESTREDNLVVTQSSNLANTQNGETNVECQLEKEPSVPGKDGAGGGSSAMIDCDELHDDDGAADKVEPSFKIPQFLGGAKWHWVAVGGCALVITGVFVTRAIRAARARR